MLFRSPLSRFWHPPSNLSTSSPGHTHRLDSVRNTVLQKSTANLKICKHLAMTHLCPSIWWGLLFAITSWAVFSHELWTTKKRIKQCLWEGLDLMEERTDYAPWQTQGLRRQVGQSSILGDKKRNPVSRISIVKRFPQLCLHIGIWRDYEHALPTRSSVCRVI
jgi:hypothetical protein